MNWYKGGIFSLVVFLTLACGKETPRAEFSILGRWQDGSNDKYFTFNADGSMRTDVSSQHVFIGKYEWDGSHLTIWPLFEKYGNGSITEHFTKVDDNTLKLDTTYDGEYLLIRR